jgi:hypothetical protein
MQTGDMKVAQEFARHGTYKMTADTYTHVPSARMRQAAKIMDGWVLPVQASAS